MRQSKTGANNSKKETTRSLEMLVYRKCIQQSFTEVGKIATVLPTGLKNKEENRIQHWKQMLGAAASQKSSLCSLEQQISSPSLLEGSERRFL